MTASRVLVYRIGQIGDTVIALPALWAIRQHFAQAHLALLGDLSGAAGMVPARHVLPGSGLFDEYLGYAPGSNGTRSQSLGQVLRMLRRQRFDTLVYLAPRLRSRRQVGRDLVFFRLAGIRRFLGHRGIDPLPGHPAGLPLPSLEHEADHLLRRLELSGIPVPAPGRRAVDLALTDVEIAAADDWLDAQRRVPAASFVSIGPGSKWSSKCWPEERFRATGAALIRRHGVHPIVFGGPEDRGLAERLIDAWGGGSSATGVLTVRQAAAAIRRCVLHVGNDNGTMHLSAAVGVPCVAIFSAQDWPGRWHPYGTGHVVLRRHVPCEGCMLATCTAEGLRCLREIGVEEVVAACDGVLSRRPATRERVAS